MIDCHSEWPAPCDSQPQIWHICKFYVPLATLYQNKILCHDEHCHLQSIQGSKKE